MIIIDSYQIPSQTSQITNFKNAKLSNCEILQNTLSATHLLKLLDKMRRYEGIRRLLLKIQRRHDRPKTDGRTNGRTGKLKPVYPFSTSLKQRVYIVLAGA